MRLPRQPNLNLLLLLLFALIAQNAAAQLAPADDFFNDGAKLYISNNIPAALERTESGLKVYPDDAKLKKLEQLLKQQQKQNQQQQKQQQQKNQQNQKSQSQNNSRNQQNQNQSQNLQSQQKQDEQKKSEQQKKQEQAQQQKADEEKKNNEKKNEAEQPVKPGQMTPQEAKRLLDSQKGDEKILQLKPPQKPENSQSKFKDW